MAAGNYYVNNTAQPGSGDHEVHVQGCYWLSLAASTTPLGYHFSCASAVQQARRTHTRANGCATCSADCHIS